MHTTLYSSPRDWLQDQRRAGTDEWQACPAGPARAAPIIDAPCASRTVARRASSGFTLIELLVVVTVTAILSSVALPSFEGVLQRTRRADVLVAMLQIQAAQERFRSQGTSYGELAEIGVASRTAAGHYTLQITAPSADGYEVLATAVGTQARDSACRRLQLSVVGANPTYASGPDATVANPDALNRKCWML